MYNLGWTPTVDSRSGSGVLSALFGAVGHDAWKPSKYATPHHQSALGFFRVGPVPQNMEKAGEIYRPKKCHKHAGRADIHPFGPDGPNGYRRGVGE